MIAPNQLPNEDESDYLLEERLMPNLGKQGSFNLSMVSPLPLYMC